MPAASHHPGLIVTKGKTAEVLTYTRRTSGNSVSHSAPTSGRNSGFYCRSLVFGVVLVAATVYIVHESAPRHIVPHKEIEKIRLLRASKEKRLPPKKPKVIHYDPPRKKYERTPFTLEEFHVKGVNLARYGFEIKENPSNLLKEPFELYEDFDLSEHMSLTGDESWADLVEIRRSKEHSSLAFYHDQIAQKRFLQAIGVPVPKSLQLYYRNELTQSHGRLEEEAAILEILPDGLHYVAKPSHKSGTFLVKYDEEPEKHMMGTRPGSIDQEYEPAAVAQGLTQSLHATVNDKDPLVRHQVQPGLILEERYTAFDASDQPPIEFNLYVIWGEVWMAQWGSSKSPSAHDALVYRNGTVAQELLQGATARKRYHTHYKKIPDWVKWGNIVAEAEQMGAHKDMLQVTVLVGAPAYSNMTEQLPHMTRQERLATVEYVVANTRVLPTTTMLPPQALDEMTRLLMAGYQMKIFTVVPNTEVPTAFLINRVLTEEDAKQLKLTHGVYWDTITHSIPTSTEG
jgi:hypothetical protein